MEIVLVILSIIGIAIGIGSLVCWIMAVVAAFQNDESPLMGILSIVLCGLGAFIIGWIKHQEYGTKQLMTIWTGLIVASIVFQILLGVLGAALGNA